MTLSVAWAVSNPLGAAPDEFVNNIKAQASARGYWLGTHVFSVQPGLPTRAREWYERSSRQYRLPISLVMPAALGCVAFHPAVSARCQDHVRARQAEPSGRGWYESPQAFYPPFVYALVGLPSRLAATYAAAGYAIRLAGAAVSALLLGAAAWVASRRSGAVSLAGVALAVTPTVLFLGSAQGTNGIEVAAGVATWAALLSGTRPDPPRGWWPLAVVAGVVWMLSRPLDVALLALTLGIVAVARGVPPVSAFGGRLRVGAGAIALAVAGLFVIVWDLQVMPPPLPWRPAVGTALHDLRAHAVFQLQQAVGVFGWTDTLVPGWVYLLWGALLAMSVASAFCLALRRGRWALVLLVGSLVAFDIAIGVFVLTPNGFEVQARYVLALAVGVPLLAAELLARQGRRALLAPASGIVVALTGVMQLVAFYANERRYAVGVRGPWWFLGRGWGPPYGQVTWLAAAVVSAMLFVVAGALVARAQQPEPPARE